MIDLIKIGQVWKYKQNSYLSATNENVILIVGMNELDFLYYWLDVECESNMNRVKIRNGNIDILLAQYKLI
jgi:hypothetical protein